MHYNELSENESFMENMQVNDIEQQHEYMEMQAMYEANQLEA